MTLIESLTLMLALVYIGAQLFWSKHTYGALAVAITLPLAVLVSMHLQLFVAFTLALIILLALKFAKPQLFANEVRINPLRQWIQHLLAISIFLSAIHYCVYNFLLQQNGTTELIRPNVVDAFLPIAGGIELRALAEYGHLDPHHPAAAVLLAVVLLTGLLCKRAFCGWACPLGLAGEYLHKWRSKFFPGEYLPPKWLDIVLRSIKYLLLIVLLYVVIGMPSALVPNYLNGYYHKVADLKMAALFASPGLFTIMALAAVLLLAAWRRQAFCRYLCPYGALLGAISLASPLKIRRNPQHCIKNAKGMPCGKCTRACPANIKVDQLITVRSDECQACLRCVAACPNKHALGMGLRTGQRLSHRGVAILLLLIMFALPFGAYLAGWWESQTPEHLRLYLMQNLDRIGM